MKAWFAIAILLLAPPAIAERSVAYCPELPARSGLAWQYLEGGDFIGCIAVRESDQTRLFGVYIGQHPSFISDPSKRRAKGIVSARTTHWQLPGPSAYEGAVLEAHVQLEGAELDPPLQSVVWVFALPRDSYKGVFRAIAQMRFRANWLDRPNQSFKPTLRDAA